jgi:alpha-L-fucosidase
MNLRASFLLILVSMIIAGEARAQTPPPAPLLPIPTARQLDWQYDEMRLFLHFGVNTFTDREWGTGEEDPSEFDLEHVDATQWVGVAKAMGFGAVILTAKHHDGFALWPSRYTDHSVRSSPWRDGNGDVVRALADAARGEDVKVGLYLSPWDRHEPSYGDEHAYNTFYMGQLRELLTQYGPLAEVWFDGAKGEDAADMDYDFDAYWAMVRQLQPGAVIFSDEGPDVRWIGNEHGFAGETNWSTFDRSRVSVGAHGIQDYLNEGERGGPDWVAGECDTSIRPGWFWHADEEP